jgi:hypothetical protein
MNRIGILVASCALVATTATAVSAADETFADCESAANYGARTAYYFVGASMNRAACDGSMGERVQQVLARSLRRQHISAHNPEALRVCFYQGLYRGYVGALEAEYVDCESDLELVPSVARAAVAVFIAMQSGLDTVDTDDVNAVFDDVFTAPPWSGVACDSYIDASDAAGLDGVAELTASVCWNR